MALSFSEIGTLQFVTPFCILLFFGFFFFFFIKVDSGILPEFRRSRSSDRHVFKMATKGLFSGVLMIMYKRV